MEAGGTYGYQYTRLALGITGDPNQAISRTREVDPNDNVTEWEFNPIGYAVSQQEFTKGLRDGEPEFFETQYEYNADGRQLVQIDPEGNEIPNIYDQNNDLRFAQGNIIGSRELADDDRGGDQSELITLNIYEPIYQQLSLTVDPRGTDETFTPPIEDPSGRSKLERYSTRYFFDYQEAEAEVVLPLLAEELNVTELEVQELLDDAGIDLGLGDINLDGEISSEYNLNLM